MNKDKILFENQEFDLIREFDCHVVSLAYHEGGTFFTCIPISPLEHREKFGFGDDRYVSEIGILDNNQNLVLVGKLSRPIKLANTTTASLELTIDF